MANKVKDKKYRCVTCSGRHCTASHFCYGCKNYVCDACENVFGTHFGLSHPLPKIGKAGRLALNGQRLDKQLKTYAECVTQFRILGAALVLSPLHDSLTPALHKQLRKAMRLAAELDSAIIKLKE